MVLDHVYWTWCGTLQCLEALWGISQAQCRLDVAIPFWRFGRNHNSYVNYDNIFGLRARGESYFLFHLFYRYQTEESVLFAIIDLVLLYVTETDWLKMFPVQHMLVMLADI